MATTVLNSLVILLEKSIYSPLLVEDPSYIGIKADFANIILFCAETKGIVVEEATGEEKEYIVLLAKKEAFMRLSVSVSPEFNVETEYTKLLKSDRFTHYIGLVAEVQKDIARIETSFSVKVANVTIDERDGTKRNYELSSSQRISPVFSITSDRIDVAWSPFDLEKGRFLCYEVMYGTSQIYDDFEEYPVLLGNILQKVVISDIFRTKARFQGLTSHTSYNVLIVFVGMNGRKTYHHSTQTTL